MPSKTLPLLFKGVVPKKEPGLLEDGELQFASNASSIQEGAIGPRLGSKKHGNGLGIGVIHSIAKLALGGADASDKRYIGSGSDIFRVDGPYDNYANVTSSLGLSSSRWEAAPFHGGESGDPTLFISHPDKMMRDNGSYTPLCPWGIYPPLTPVMAALADPSLPDFIGFVLLTSQAGGTNRLTGISVSSATQIGPSYYTITPSSMAGIAAGMYVDLGGRGFVVIDSVTASTFNVYVPPVPSGVISSYYNVVNKRASDNTAISPLVADGSEYYADFNANVDWSFNGDPSTGYDSTDLIHFGLWVTDFSDIQEIRVRVLLAGSSTDYYEKAVTPPQTQAFASGTATATAAQQQRSQAILNAVYGTSTFPDSISQQLQPVEFGANRIGDWQEFDVSKNDFLAVGQAGIGEFSWKNVTGVRVFVISQTVAGAPAFEVRVGAIYAHGGQGPDSESVATSIPYDYVFTFRNPITQEEGNPCAVSVPRLFVHTQLRAVELTLTGTNTGPLTGNPLITGPGSIAVYRRGGIFTDSFYRFLGYAANPGAGSTVTFIDNFSDFAIAGNRTCEFDNFPPVASNLPVAFNAIVSSVSAGPMQVSTLTFTGYTGSDLNAYFAIGSKLTIGSGANQEDCLVISVTSGNIDVYLQLQHFPGEPATCGFKIGSPCDVVCQAGDSLLLAGNEDNPHVIYRSKAGNPHAWPIINLETGNSHQVICGSPDNPIRAMAEYGGGYVALNATRIFTFQIWLGQIINVTESPSSNGLAAKHLWVKTEYGIAYLSYDGIYLWAGGGSVKLTEDLDWIFKGQNVGGFQPLDTTLLADACLFYFQNYLWFLYKDTGGNNTGIRYNAVYKRWEPVTFNASGHPSALTAAFAEKDTGRLIGGVFENNAGSAFLYELETGTSDGWNSLGTDGVPVEWEFKTGFMAPEDRSVTKQFTDISIEVQNPLDPITVNLYYDYSDTADANDTFVIPSGSGRRFATLPLQQIGGSSAGKEARVVAFEFLGSSTGPVNIYSIHFDWIPLAEVQKGRVWDWDDLGHKWDKRIYEITIDYNVYGHDVTLYMDTIGGLYGNVISLGVQTIVLSGNGRSQQGVPIADGLPVKKVRLRPAVPNQEFLIFSVAPLQQENWPPDVSLFSPWSEEDTKFDKYLQQVILEVNTNNLPVQVKIQGDGVDLETITVNTTVATRNFIYTVNSPLKAKRFRLLVVTPLPANAYFQLWSVAFNTQPADKGPVSHTEDFKEFDSPNDKHLSNIFVEYENSASSLILQLDILSGVGATIETDDAVEFTLNGSGSGRITQQFPIADTVPAGKRFRLRPKPGQTIPGNFRIWSWRAEYETWPVDTVLWTPWNDFGYQHDKYCQEIRLDVDTGNVPASVKLQADGGDLQTLTVTSNQNNREVIQTLNPQLRGKKFRLLIAPGVGAGSKFQLWKWDCHFEKADRGDVSTNWDYDTLGYFGDKHLQEVTLEWDNGGQTFVMLMDTISGIDGNTEVPDALSFTLAAPGRARKTFPIPDGFIVKMIRLHAQSTITTLKHWAYEFKKVDFPADTSLFTEWSDLGWKWEKVFRGFTVEIDTASVNCTINAEIDGVIVQSFTVNTHQSDRIRILALQPNVIGKQARITLAPGFGGKAQLFNVTWDFWNEPPLYLYWDSSENIFGSEGYRITKQCWLDYMGGGMTVQFYRDNGTLFYSVTLPEHPQRDVERWFFPKINNGVLNKTKRMRVIMTATDPTKPWKIYGDGSRLETKNMSGDTRAAWEQHRIWMAMSKESGA